MMRKSTKYRDSRCLSLPTAVLLLALGVSFASVGQAEEVLDETVVTAKRLTANGAQDLRPEIEATTEDAAWRTRIRVAANLSARLNVQHRPYRLASRSGQSWRKTG